MTLEFITQASSPRRRPSSSEQTRRHRRQLLVVLQQAEVEVVLAARPQQDRGEAEGAGLAEVAVDLRHALLVARSGTTRRIVRRSVHVLRVAMRE